MGALLGERMPKKLKTSLPLTFGFAAIAMGVFLIVKMENLTIVVLSLLLGVCAGELLDLEHRLHRGIKKLGTKIDMFNHTDEQRERYITLIVIFCAGGTGIFGALMEGIDGDSSILLTKSTLDFFTSMIFASSLGYSVMALGFFQVVPFLALFFSAHLIAPLLTPSAVANFTGIGGIISVVIGFRLAHIKHVDVTNLLPALLIVLFLSRIL